MDGPPVRRPAAIALAAGLAFAGSAPEAAAKPKLPSRTVVCGEVLTESLRVANNLQDCPGAGLVVGAPGISIDLGGHRIDGVLPGTSAGIDNGAGHDDVTIQNGTVSEFADGVRLENASGNTLRLLRIQDTSAAGIHLIASSNNTLQENTASGNQDFGIHLESGSDANTLASNEASGSGSDGFYAIDCSANAFTANRVLANAGYGIEIFGSDNTLKGNVVEGNSNGIVIDGTPTGNLLKGNRASANDANGIQVFEGSDNLLLGNATHENGLHGIVSDTSALTLKKNKADGNGFLGGGAGDDAGLGLSVPAGATASGNKAAGNDDPNECEASDLDCHVP